MRLTPLQVDAIRVAATNHFGQNSQVWLFGSRVNKHAKGGDIDLYIETEIQDAAELIESKLHFLVELHKKLGDQKIDVVIRYIDSEKDLPIFHLARETGIQLL